MPLLGLFGKASALVEHQELAASYFDPEIAELSPWADSDYLEQITASDLLGFSDGIGSRSNAMRIASVAKARNLICTTIARMPLLAMQDNEKLKKQPTFLKQLQSGQPNFHVVSWIVDHTFFYGRSWQLITARGAKGEILDTQFVPKSEAEVDDGRLIKAFGKPVTQSEVIRIDAANEGFLRYGRDVILEAWEIDKAAREAGANPVPSLILKQREGADIRPEKVKEILGQWSRNRRKRFGSVAYLNKALDPIAIGQSAENLLIDARNYSVLQIARATGLPAWALDGAVQGANLNYQNQASRNREIIDAISPLMLAIEQTYSLFLPRGQEVRFDTTEMLRADTKDRYESYKTGIDAGFLDIPEVRRRENLPAQAAPKEIKNGQA